MKDTLTTIATGVTGVGAVQIAESIPTSDDIQNYGQLLIQFVIGLVTIWKMLRNRKKNAVSDSEQNQ